jgi:Fuc2NAc and GlcNAc transferase
MLSFVLVGAAAILLSAFLVGVVRRQQILDIPNERSSHAVPTPRGGGVGIGVGSLVVTLIAWIVEGELTAKLAYCLIASAFIMVLGWIDDRRSLSAKLRLLMQAVVALVLILLIGGGGYDRFDIPVVGVLDLPEIIGILFAMVLIVAVTNFYNFMDGIDGIAGMQAVVAGIGWVILLLRIDQEILALFPAAIVAASIGFLFWNWPPAKIFMGDVGSTYLGFSFMILPLMATTFFTNDRLLVAGVLMVGTFVFDATLTIFRRAMAGENILAAHRSHLYQRLIKLGYPHLQVTLLYSLLFAISSACALFYFENESPELAVLVFLVVHVLLLFVVTSLERNRGR